MSKLTMLYDPEGDHGHPLVLCSDKWCNWGRTDTSDLNAVRELWKTHVTEYHAEPHVVETSTLRVAGQRFVCECGASVFAKLSNDTFRCNGCRNVYG